MKRKRSHSSGFMGTNRKLESPELKTCRTVSISGTSIPQTMVQMKSPGANNGNETRLHSLKRLLFRLHPFPRGFENTRRIELNDLAFAK